MNVHPRRVIKAANVMIRLMGKNFFFFLIIWLSKLLTFEGTWWRLFQKCVLRSKFNIYVLTCVAKGGSRSRNCFLRPSIPARQYLLSVICNSNSFQSILFRLCTVFVYILKMCTSSYGLIWQLFSLISLYVELNHLLSLYDIDGT